MSTGILEVIKQVAVNAYNSTNPVALLYGHVISVNPIKIKITDTLTLDQEFFVVQGELTVGDEVSLFRQQGGQKFVVLGKRTKTKTNIVELGGTTK